MHGVPTKAMIRDYGLKEARTMMQERTDEYGREIVNAEQLPVRVEVLVPTPDGEGEIVDARGTSIVDAVENAVVAYGDAELMFPIEPGDVVYVGDLSYLSSASELSARA